MSEVVVVRVGKLLLGLPASEIVDVVYLAQADITAIPVASHGAANEYCAGVAQVAGRTVSLFDIEKFLTASELRAAEPAQ
jgi:chemotaxis signal transduction protein